MSDRRVSENRRDDAGIPDEPPPDSFEWTGEPQDPDAAGMPGEFVDEPHAGVPGVRSTGGPPD